MKYIMANCLILWLVGCTTINMLGNWKGPDSAISIGSLKKVLVIAYLNNKSSRINVERQFCTLFNGRAIASNQYFENDIECSEQTDRILRKEGFDGAVVLRLVKTGAGNDYFPGHYPSYYYNFKSFQQLAMNCQSQPGNAINENRYCVETNVYSLKKDALLWTGLTGVINPSNWKNSLDDIAKMVFHQMK